MFDEFSGDLSCYKAGNQWCTEAGFGEGGWTPPPPKFPRPPKTVKNPTRLWKLLKIAEFRTPTPQDVSKKGSKILKLPRFAIVYITYLLTPRCRVLLEKLTGLQLVKKSSAFHGTRRFITALTLAMTNQLVVIINSLKVPKIKKILLYEMKFLVPNYSCLQNPD